MTTLLTQRLWSNVDAADLQPSRKKSKKQKKKQRQQQAQMAAAGEVSSGDELPAAQPLDDPTPASHKADSDDGDVHAGQAHVRQDSEDDVLERMMEASISQSAASRQSHQVSSWHRRPCASCV